MIVRKHSAPSEGRAVVMSGAEHRHARRRDVRLRVIAGSMLVVAACGGPTGPADAGAPETDGGPDAGGADAVTILRDAYGIPHVFSSTRTGAAYALGWTDGEDLGARSLELLYVGSGDASGRLGVACGAMCTDADVFVHAYGLSDAVDTHYDALSPETRAWLEAYAAGLAAFFRRLSAPPATFVPDDPPTGRMVATALLYYRAQHALSETTRGSTAGGGSNQLVISGARTAGQTTFVVKDPHSPLQPSQRYAHLSVDGFDVFGNFALGVMGCGSNEAVGFGCTRAGTTPGVRVVANLRYVGEHAPEGACDAAPAYELSDGGTYTALGMRCLPLAHTAVWMYASRFGPVSSFGADADADGHPDTVVSTQLFAAADIASVDVRARAAFVTSTVDYLQLFSGPTPPEDAQYRAFADRDHHLGALLGTTAPVLDDSLDWTAPVSSDDPRIDGWTSSRDWSDLSAGRWHNIDGVPPELPHVVDPDGDFFVNCNGNPNFGTDPNGQFGDLPVTLERASGPTNREERIYELVHDAVDLDRGGVVRVMTDLRVPLVPELARAAACGVDALGVDPVVEWGDGGRLLETLIAWEDTGYEATPDSEAATIAALLETAVPTLAYPTAGSCLSRAQLDTLAGTVFRDAIAPFMRATYGAQVADPLRVPWGHLNYVVVGGREVGLHGMAVGRLVTVLPSAYVGDAATGRADPSQPRVGSALLQITSFSDRGFEVWIMPPFGQIDETIHPASPHIGQTIDAYVARAPRAVWLDRAEIEANLCPFAGEPGHEHAARTVLDVP